MNNVMPWDRASLRPKKKIPKFIRNNNIRFNIIIMESFDEVTMRVKYQMTATSRGAIGGIMRATNMQFVASFQKRISHNM
jgi:hypothetical protein